MPASCCAYGCKGRAAKDGLDHTVTFHHIPKDPIRQKKWVLAMRWINFKPGKFSFICSRHFEEHCFDRTGQTVRLRDYAIPSIFNFPPHLQKHKKKRTTRTSQAATLQNVPVNDTAVAPGATSLIQQEGKKSPKDHTYHVSEEAKDLKRRLDDLTEALVAAKKRIVLLSGKAARLSRSNAYLKNLVKDLRVQLKHKDIQRKQGETMPRLKSNIGNDAERRKAQQWGKDYLKRPRKRIVESSRAFRQLENVSVQDVSEENVVILGT